MATGWPMKTTYANGDVFSASDVNDITGTVNLAGGAQWAAGKNKIINGNFGIWQRGTSFTASGTNTYTADRFQVYHNGSTAGTNTVSQQTFTPGTAPVSGYEGTFFLRWTATTLGTGQSVADVFQRIEDVRQFAGQTIIVSFWLKSSSSFTPAGFVSQNFGSGGSTQVDTALTFTGSASTSWQRFSASIAVPSVASKTIGTSSYIEIRIRTNTPVAGQTIDIWGVQAEQGSTATAFQTATGTIQGELAACQRYYYLKASGTDLSYGMAAYNSASDLRGSFSLPVEMRIAPTLIAASGTNYYIGMNSDAFNSLTQQFTSKTEVTWYNVSEVSGTAGYGMPVRTNNASSSIALSAEL